MPRTPTRRYVDPLDEIWLTCARRIGLRVERSPEVYASTDGRGTMQLADRDLDADDCLTQMIFHELCHSLIEGPDSFQRPDWGLDNTGPHDGWRERGCLRLQAHLASGYGLRRTLAPTTDFREFYDALADDPVEPRHHPEVSLAILGVVTGVLALAFVQFLYFLEELFARWSWPPVVKAAIAGLAVGGLGYVARKNLGGPFLFGVGYDGISAALELGHPEGLDLSLGGGLTITALVLLMLLKIPATSLSLAGGGSGGVFAPALFIGAMAGGAFGLLVNAIFPGMTAPAGAYALVGMGAVFAGAAHAPIASILILFEMTDDYQIILPLMLAVVMSYLIASRLNPDSIYTIKLRRRGGLTPPDHKTSVLDQILVADAMTMDYETVPAGEPVATLSARFHGSHVRAYAVLDDDDGKLVGIVTEYDVETALMAGDVAAKRAGDIMTSHLITCTPVQTMRTVLSTFANRDVGQIPVVAADDPGKLVGVLRRSEIFWAYGQLAIEHRKMLLETVMDLPDDHGDSIHVKLEVSPENERLAFKKIRDIPVPDQTLIAVLIRGGRSIVPRGNTVVEPGDVLVLLTIRAREPSLRRWVASVGG